MYRPSWLNFTSEIDEMISEKKDRFVGSSSSSNTNPGTPPQRQRLRDDRDERLTLRMLIAQRGVPHVSKLDVAFRTAVHEEVAMYWVELRRSDDLRQFFHVRGFDVDDVLECVQLLYGQKLHTRALTETAVADVQVP